MGLYEEFASYPFYKKVIVTILTVCLMVGLWYYFYYSSQMVKKNKLKEEIERLYIYKQQLPILEKRYVKAKEDFKKFSKILPVKQEIPSLLVNLSHIIKKENVTLLTFNPKRDIDKGRYVIKPISISMEGDYIQCGSVFEKISKMPRLMKVVSFSIRPVKVMNRHEVLLSMSFNAQTYYLKSKKSGKK